MNLKKLVLLLAAVVLVAGLFACSSKQVTRVDADTQIDLSGYWNATDSRLTADQMIAESFASPWIDNFVKANNRQPVVIIGTIVNRSEEHIPINTFVSDLQRALVNSGRVIFVATAAQREELRAERGDQTVNASTQTANAAGNETAADFMLKGQINTIFDSGSGAQVKFYQVDLELISIATNQTVWMGQKKIQKVVSRRAFRP